MKRNAMRWLIRAGLVYAGVLVLLMFLETKLVYPAPRDGSAIASEFSAHDVEFESSDGTLLHGWYFEKQDASNTLVFFHGNGECIEQCGPWIGEFGKSLDASVFVFDYRGYGKSQGSPFEKGVVEDGLAAIEWLMNRTGKPSGEFIYLGRSLGGGVAVQVAKEHPPKGLIFISTFSSLVDVAQKAYWWLPVRWVIRNRFDSVSAMATIDVPLLQIHGDRDRIIPIDLGKKLFDTSPSQSKTFLTATGFGHNDLSLDTFYQEIRNFLKSP